jgi:hypothetical protein
MGTETAEIGYQPLESAQKPGLHPCAHVALRVRIIIVVLQYVAFGPSLRK